MKRVVLNVPDDALNGCYGRMVEARAEELEQAGAPDRAEHVRAELSEADPSEKMRRIVGWEPALPEFSLDGGDE